MYKELAGYVRPKLKSIEHKGDIESPITHSIYRCSQLQVPVNDKLIPLLTKKKRFKIVIGGRGSGKSQGVADCLLLKGQEGPLKVGCFREFQNSISDSFTRY